MDIQKIDVKLSGISDIMFDRFVDYSTERRPPEQKLYLDDQNTVVLPSENISAFLFGNDPAGCAKVFEGTKGKNYIRMGGGHVFVDPVYSPFLDGAGKPIKFDGFKKKLWIHKGSPRVKKGTSSIKCEEKERPVLRLPWSIKFQVSIAKNVLIEESKLYNWFCAGGVMVSIGTYRPRFGRFEVAGWDVK